MKKNHLYFLLYILPVALLLMAGCGTPTIKDGNTAYQLKKYQLAAQLLVKDYTKAVEGPEKGKIAYKIAQSYHYINDTKNAEKWYYNALVQGVEADVKFDYAKMLMANQKYDEAIKTFKQVLREEPYRRSEIRKQINACELAKDWLSGSSNTTIENISSINSSKADFSPVLLGDKMVFVSSRPIETEEDPDQWTGNRFYDIFVATRQPDGTFTKPEIFSEQFRTKYNDGPVAFSPGGAEIFITQCGSAEKNVNDYCSIFYSKKVPEGGWSEPELLPLFDDSMNIGQPAISNDGQVMVFAAVDPMGAGGSDLYYTKRTFEGWDFPMTLGLKINTSGDEVFPYFDENDNLYFSSNGLPGMGGLDIFIAEKAGKTKWKRPKNIGYPLNSSADDFGVVILPLSEEEKILYDLRGYLSSSREGGKGLDDIYYFEKAKPPLQYVLEGQVLANVLKDTTDPNSEIIDTIPLANAKVVFSKVTNNGLITLDTLITNEEGHYVEYIEEETEYKLLATSEPHYFSKSDQVSTVGLTGNPGDEIVLKSTLILDRIVHEAEIVIPNIYYDFNDWKIRPDAALVLDTTIYILLEENPKLTIELGSHTDARGEVEFNMELSRKRAKSVVDYLVKKGIERKRLVPKGYGESQPFVEADGTVLDEAYINSLPTEAEREEAHQKNRRTTFRVKAKDKIIDSQKPDNMIVNPKD
jgi:peptidoglycan-associated lipoprotein